MGRALARQEIVEWLGHANRGVLAVTGGPGTGKSAILGWLARQSVGDPASVVDEVRLPKDTFDAIIYAKAKTVGQVEQELAHLPRSGPRRCWLTLLTRPLSVRPQALRGIFAG